MFSFKTLTGALASFATLQGVSAYLDGFTVPSTAFAGRTISVQSQASIYIQQEFEYGIVWGLYGHFAPCDTCVGTPIQYTNIYGEASYADGQATTQVTIPADTTAGNYEFVAAIPALAGVSGEMSTRYFRYNITISSA
ncbi:hypothetical protein B7463_g10847, partial [Scytalidium lignicola]